MTDDYYAQMYWSGVNNYDVELADLKAELTRAQANGDFAGAVAAAQRMADVNVRAREFGNLYQQHLHSVTAQQPRELSPEELRNLPDEHHNWDTMAASGMHDTKWGTVRPGDPDFEAAKARAAQDIAMRSQYRR